MRAFTIIILFCVSFLSKADDDTLNFIGNKTKKDTTQYFNIFNQFNWDAEFYSGNNKLISYSNCKPDTLENDSANIIFLHTSFKINSGLMNKNFVFRYKIDGSLHVRINGLPIITLAKPLHTKSFTFFDEEQEGYVYFTFPEKSVRIDMIMMNAEIENVIEGKFEIETLNRKDERISKQQTEKQITILISFFYLAIGLVLLILFLYHKQSIENFYFAFFCLLYSVSSICDLFPLSSFVESLSTALSAYSLYFLMTYLSLVLTGKSRSKIPLLVFSAILILCILQQLIFQYKSFTHVIILIVSVLYIIFNFFLAIYLLFQGNSRKKWEIKFIKYGFFSALFFLFGIFIVLIFVGLATKGNFNTSSTQAIFSGFTDCSRAIGLLLIPTTIAVIIGKRNGLNQKELEQQLLENKILSEQNLQKEKEKQSILFEQNLILEEKVNERTLDLQHEKELVEVKNREILDSIEYALRIQTAILPPLRIVKEYLTNSFILYQPKDIVAGDFYWMETTNNWVLFAACDCTGHGVSGAMVSVLCNNALNRAVREYNLIDPASILNKTNEIIVENFSKSEEEIKDGMDISICAFNTKTQVLKWAGANNPLWLIKNGELIETKGDKQCIGMNENFRSFTNHEFILNSGDSLYIFSDGFADQFGGETGELKLSKKRFKELILSNQTALMEEQGKNLEKFMHEYRKEAEQTDDILVMGIKI